MNQYLCGMNKNSAVVNLRSFKQKVRHHRSSFRRFLTRLEKKSSKQIASLTGGLEKEVWKEVDCLSCANCCKTMTPTYTLNDIKKISAHFGMTQDQFKKKWLRKERSSGDWLNKSLPCQFLNLKNNQCTIYDVRPADCAGFPHLQKNIKGFVHVHKQNIEFCPATYKLVEKMKERLDHS
jgi:Fe-S-cluster containining protein